jgi:hypothetical protein
MDKSTKDLLSTWRGMLPLSKPPYILPGDEVLIRKGLYHSYSSFETYIDDPQFGKASPHKIHSVHSGLIPFPYDGDILKAKIYILTLNPGFVPDDYYAESHDRVFRDARIRCLQQEHLDKDFPFMNLNPRFSYHGGYQYWASRLGDIIDKVSEQRHVSYREALSLLSQKIALLEYVPYHSERYRVGKAVVDEMRSPMLIKAFVKSYVVPRTENGDAVIIVTRKVREWGVSELSGKRVVYNRPGESISARLNSKSRGGRLIAKVMEIKP